MTPVARRPKIAHRMIITTVDVIHLRSGAKAPVFELYLADPVRFLQHLPADFGPVFWEPVAAAGCFPPHGYPAGVLSGNG